MNKFEIETRTQTDDGIGGYTEAFGPFKTVYGYLDMISGTDENTKQNAFIEQSTHVLIVPEYTAGITDGMRIVDEQKRWYSITYADDPMGVHHHLEVYCTFGGVRNG